MTIYDVSVPIKEGMLVWPGDSGVSIEVLTTVASEKGSKNSRFSFGSHTGTHVDAPSHFIEGATGIDKIDTQKLYGPCEVLDLEGIDQEEIVPSDFKDVILRQRLGLKGSRILFKTGNYKYLQGSEFPEKYVSLSLEGAEYLIDKGVVMVGTDFLGIEKRKNPGHPVHTALLKAGIVIVEGLDFSKVPPGSYTIICMPLRVVDSDGAPARVLLIKD